MTEDGAAGTADMVAWRQTPDTVTALRSATSPVTTRAEMTPAALGLRERLSQAAPVDTLADISGLGAPEAAAWVRALGGLTWGPMHRAVTVALPGSPGAACADHVVPFTDLAASFPALRRDGGIAFGALEGRELATALDDIERAEALRRREPPDWVDAGSPLVMAALLGLWWAATTPTLCADVPVTLAELAPLMGMSVELEEGGHGGAQD
ncbi:hypothetical protein ACF064_01565 [Streptomyces sp. NPDC015492]|uniref:hypothetical protein n=1 Tax=Streptomyces sp. NPDC015492 TaxID=3364958 RepID=UPI003702452B